MKSLTLDEMRHAVRLAGFEWTDAELAALRPGLARALEALEALERLPLEDAEPATQYRVL
jgi:Asp-tRNA(Asn)/Glu-tRNA(Gln) amidotransferase C subunit